MMIKLARNAEANAKLQPKKPGGKSPVNISQKWIYIVFVALLAFQVYLNIAAYYAVLSGMKNYSLFIVGTIMLVFAAMFHIFRYGRALAKAPAPKPVPPPPRVTKPALAPPSTPPSKEGRPLAAPPAQKSGGNPSSAPQNQQPSQPQSSRGTSAASSTTSDPTLSDNNLRNTTMTPPSSHKDVSGTSSTDIDRKKV
jgi:ubiquinol-cytochrome c reductase cytochrome b subunit